MRSGMLNRPILGLDLSWQELAQIRRLDVVNGGHFIQPCSARWRAFSMTTRLIVCSKFSALSGTRSPPFRRAVAGFTDASVSFDDLSVVLAMHSSPKPMRSPRMRVRSSQVQPFRSSTGPVQLGFSPLA